MCLLLGTCSTTELHHQEKAAFCGFQSPVPVLPTDPESVCLMYGSVLLNSCKDPAICDFPGEDIRSQRVRACPGCSERRQWAVGLVHVWICVLCSTDWLGGAKVAGHFKELTKNSACSKNGSRAFSCSSSARRMREALSRYSWADSSRGDTR